MQHGGLHVLKKKKSQGVTRRYSLIVEAAASAGGVAMFGEGVAQLAVQLVSYGPRDAFPGQNKDDDDGVCTVVARTVTHQTQQLFCLTPTTDHLEGNQA